MMESRREAQRGCPPPTAQRGIALVLVIWVIMLLSVMAGAVVVTQRTEASLARNLIDSYQGKALAQAGVYYGLMHLLYGSTDLEEKWQPDGQARDWSYAGAQLRITLRDESARIDLNKAEGELLEELLLGAGVEEEEAQALRDAILDWRDSDNAHLLNGAEDEEYAAQGLLFGAKDAEFDTVGELQQVLGMTPQIFAALEPALTVYSGKSTVNPIFASTLVLSALPGMTAEELERYLELRDQHLADGTAVPMPVGVEAKYLNQGVGPIYRISSEATVPASGGVHVVEAVVQTGRGENGYIVLAWNHFRRPTAVGAGAQGDLRQSEDPSQAEDR